MSATLDYAIKPAMKFLTKDNRWNVLTVLILHANVRNRCWPSVETLSEMGTNGNLAKAVRAKKWLEKHGAFELVPHGKRVGEETKLKPRQHVYQMTGVIQCCKDKECDCGGTGLTFAYLHLNPSTIENNKTSKVFDGENFKISDGENHVSPDEISTIENVSITIEQNPIEQPTLPAAKNGRKQDPEYNAIAELWHTDASGMVCNLKGMLFGTRKVRGAWKECALTPYTTIDELRAFANYAKRRMPPGAKEVIPTAPVTIQRWFCDFRTAKIKKSSILTVEFEAPVSPMDRNMATEGETA